MVLRKMRVNRVTLMVEDQGEGPAILTLHGGPGMGSRRGDASTYGTFAGEGYRVVSYDQRGNGESEGQAPYSHSQFIADAESIRQQLGLGKIVIAGGSYGGYLAQEYTLKYPENIVGMVLRDTAASNAYRNTAKERALQSGLPGITEEELDRLFDGRVHSDDDFKELYRTILPLYWVSATQEQMTQHLEQIRFRHETHNWAFSQNLPNFNLVPRLKEIHVPTLVTVGRHDWITPLEASEEIAAETPHSRLVVFDNSGHSPQVEEREKWLGEVRAFLRAVYK